MKSIKFVFLLPLFVLRALSLDCREFVTRISEKNYAGDIQEVMFLDYSAKNTSFTTEIGDYDSCTSSDLMKYFLAIRTTHSDLGAQSIYYRGVCLPKECEDQKILNDQALIIKIFQARNWEYSSNDTFELYDTAEDKTSKSPFFYIACLLFAGLLFINLYSTFSILLNNKQHADLSDSHSYEKHWLIKSFNMRSNFLDMYKTASEQKLNQNVSIFGFLRVICSYWVVAVHCYNTQYFPLLIDRDITGDWWNNILGSISVEPFFIITGFLGAYVLVPKLSKRKFDIWIYLEMIKHRLLRIWPVLIVGLLLFWQIAPHLFKGPLMYRYQRQAKDADPWNIALLISNLYPNNGNKREFYGASWYVACDFQMYLVLIVVIALYTKHRRIGYTVVIALILQSLTMGIVSCFRYNIDFVVNQSHQPNPNYYTHFSSIPCKRWYPTFIGALWGLLYYEYTKSNSQNIFAYFEKSPILCYILIIIGIALNWIAFFPPFTIDQRRLSLVWYPLQMLIVDILIIMIFMPLLSNRQFYLKRFFNLRIFQVFGKASYCLYLIHQSLARGIAYSNPDLVAGFSFFIQARFLIICILCAQPVAILLHALVEIPIHNIEKHFDTKKPKDLTINYKSDEPAAEEKVKLLKDES